MCYVKVARDRSSAVRGIGHIIKVSMNLLVGLPEGCWPVVLRPVVYRV